MIRIEEALKILEKEVKILGLEERNLLSAMGRVLGEDVHSMDNLPPFNKSAMDGYAIKYEDTENCSINNRAELNIRGIIKAGDFCEEELQFGDAYKIMTGAPIPTGANAVIEIEKVELDENKLYISQPIKEGNHIIRFGEEIKIGDIALNKGTVIRPSEIGFLASLGISSVKVYRSPVVALIITGSELIDINSEPQKGKIRNSNEYSLRALIKNLDAECLSLGITSDEKSLIKEKVKYALENADIVISSGGASVGDYDFVKEVLMEIGAEVKFNKVAIKPGKPVTFATYKDKLFFALPGNPSALITTFEEFVKPAIEKMMGKAITDTEEFQVVLTDDFKAQKGRRKYIYVQIKKEKGTYYAYKVGSQCSNHLKTMSQANGMIIIPEDCGTVHAGEVVNGKFIFK